ncbi:MAG: hypothetical protein KF681_04525 [Bdellovibrionaceae bacterium]|nr:hypothetical protein [Pseudobdellovibrionaceae bacterium]
MSMKKRILSHGQGWCFTPKHFLDLGTDTAVRKFLSLLQKQGVIRRIAQGLYDYPREHNVLGKVPPSIDAVATAIAEKNGAKIQPTGAYAANLIGISDQVPGRVIFLTDGPPKKLKIGKLEIVFKQSTVKNMFAAGSREALVIQALKFMGKDQIDETVLKTVKSFLKSSKRREFEKNIKFAPQWIRSILLNLMKDEL